MSVSSIIPERLAYRYNEAAKLLALSPRTIWSLCASGQLRTFRCGRAVRISADEIRRFISERQTAPRSA